MTLHSLPIFVRLAGRAVILLGTGEAADAKRRLLERAGAMIVGEEATASLAIVAPYAPAVRKIARSPETTRSMSRPIAKVSPLSQTGPAILAIIRSPVGRTATKS